MFNKNYGGFTIVDRGEDYKNDLLRQQATCQEAFNNGMHMDIALKVNQLQRMIYPSMWEDEFEKEIDELEEKWDKYKKAEMEEYNKMKKKSASPDLVPEPSELPPIEYFDIKYQICLRVMDKFGLLLKKRQQAYM